MREITGFHRCRVSYLNGVAAVRLRMQWHSWHCSCWGTTATQRALRGHLWSGCVLGVKTGTAAQSRSWWGACACQRERRRHFSLLQQPHQKACSQRPNRSSGGGERTQFHPPELPGGRWSAPQESCTRRGPPSLEDRGGLTWKYLNQESTLECTHLETKCTFSQWKRGTPLGPTLAERENRGPPWGSFGLGRHSRWRQRKYHQCGGVQGCPDQERGGFLLGQIGRWNRAVYLPLWCGTWIWWDLGTHC